MAVTGLTVDSHFVFDDDHDDLGRKVTTPASAGVPGMLVGGIAYSLLTAAPPSARVVTGITRDQRFVFDDFADELGRRVTTAATVSSAGMVLGSVQYFKLPLAAGPTYSQSLADVVGLAEDVKKLIAAGRADAVALGENVTRATARTVGDALGLSENDIEQTRKQLAENIDLQEALTTRFVHVQALTESLGAAESLLGGAVLPVMAETFQLGEAQRRTTMKTLLEAAALNEVQARLTGKGMVDSFNPTEQLATVVVKLQALAETAALAESAVRQLLRAVAESPTLAEALTAVPSSGGAQFQRSVGDTVALSEGLDRRVLHPAADSSVFSESWQVRVARNIQETLGIGEALTPRVARVLGFATPLDLTETLQAFIVKAVGLGESFAPSESIAVVKTASQVRPVRVIILESLSQTVQVGLYP